MNIGSASVVPAKYAADGRPEFEAAELKELEARSRGPDVLTSQEMAMVATAKDAGNSHFRSGRIHEACAEYNRALHVFSDRNGGPDQRVEKSKLLANRAECLLRLEDWEHAEFAARRAIALDATNTKARYRRARALEGLGGEANLDAGMEELKLIPQANKEQQLLFRRLKEAHVALRSIRQRDAGGLRRAFASGNSGLAMPSDANASAAPIEAPIVTTSSTAATLPPWLQPLIGRGVDVHRMYLLDVYRTAVEDKRRSVSQTILSGGSQPTDSPASVTVDFLVFCKLACTRGVLPATAGWDWASFLAIVPTRLVKRFSPEISGSVAFYGPDAGAPATMRRLVTRIYHSDTVGRASCQRSTDQLRAEWQRAVGFAEQDLVADETDEQLEGRRVQHMITFDRDPTVFAEVGGVQAWRTLLRQVADAFRGVGMETPHRTVVGPASLL